MAGPETNYDAHGFPLAREWNHLHDLCRVAGFLPVFPTEILGELKKGSLSLGSYESKFFGLLVDILKGGGIYCNRLIEQAPQLRGKDRVDVSLLDREVVGVFPVHLRPAGGLGDVLFLGLCLSLIGCVRAGLVLLEVANEFGVDTNRTSDDAHEILSKRAGLVGTNDGGVCHSLARAENTNEEVFGGHPLGSESKRQSHRKWEAFRNSDDNQCD